MILKACLPPVPSAEATVVKVGKVELTHRRSLPLAPGEIVPLEIEILPSGTRFGPGETLRLVIQGRDSNRPEELARLLLELT